MGIKPSVLFRCKLFTGINTKNQGGVWNEEVTTKTPQDYFNMLQSIKQLLSCEKFGVYKVVAACMGNGAANELVAHGRISGPQNEGTSSQAAKRKHGDDTFSSSKSRRI